MKLLVAPVPPIVPALDQLARWLEQLRNRVNALGAPTGFLNVLDFGVNGTATDPINMARAIDAAITLEMKLYAPQMTIAMGTTTLVFPATMPLGFTFACDPGCIINYTGTGNAISIDSCGLCLFQFGQIRGSGGANAIYAHPTVAGSFGGQTTLTCNTIEFNLIEGFYCGIRVDLGIGDFAQNNIKGMFLLCGRGGVTPGSMTGVVRGIYVTGRVGGIYQGNMWDVNYIYAYAASFQAGVTWRGIEDGDTTMGDTNNVNTYQYGAIDAVGWLQSWGVITYGNRNTFQGPIVDIHICFQLGTTAYFIYIFAGSLSTLSGGTDYEIRDLSVVVAWHWTWMSASDGRTGDLVTGFPPPLGGSDPVMLASMNAAVVLPAAVVTPIPVVQVRTRGSGLTIAGGGIKVATEGYYILKGQAVIATGSPVASAQLQISINSNVGANTRTASFATGDVVPLCCDVDMYLFANDVVYLCASVTVLSATVYPSTMGGLSVIGPLSVP